MVKRFLMLVVGSLAMVACGPGAKIDGKQGAAEALLAATQPWKAKAETSATPVTNISWACPEGGTAAISGASINIGTGGTTDVSAGVTLSYRGCGLAKGSLGVAVFNGDMTFSNRILAGQSSAAVDLGIKGLVHVQGAYDDFLEADVVEKLSAADLGTKGVSVAMSIKGTVKTGEGTFTFDEMLSVMSGTISAKVQASK